DGDGRKEIVQQNDNNYVYVLSTASARVLAEFKTDFPAGWTVRSFNEPAVADVDRDGALDIVVVNSAAVVCVFEYVASSSTSTSFSFAKRWCHRMTAHGGTAADAGPAVADADGDGRMEIFSQTETVGQFAYNADGSVRWSRANTGGNAGPLVTDLEGDGRKEVLFFGDAGEVKALDASTGSTRWSFWASNYVRPASIPVSGAAGDLDGDGRKEVVFMARDAHESTYPYANNHLMLFVLSASGGLKWRAQPSWAHPLSYTHPVLLDVDGDGRKEILAQDWNTIGHKPGNWEALGDAHVFLYDASGGLRWMTTVDNTWSNDDLAVADVDNDGRMEVLAIGRNGGDDGVWYLDARTGAKEAHVSSGGWTALRAPVVGDLDGSGRISWALPIHDGARGGGFRFYQTDAPCRVAFGGWMNPKPCGGSTTEPPPPPPPTGDFTATFSTNGGNEWWIAAKVSASRPLAGVDARVNGGAWQPLTFRSWGEWAGSYRAPEGAAVQFRARDSGGAEALSGCYRWVSGAPTACSGGAGGGTTGFSATFRNPRGNEWWIEVDVSSTSSLAGVDARVNGGAWTALEKKSWGSWAKSMPAPTGSTVEFRARGASGGEAVSAPYRWPPA
ncbi:MAG TPA: VCBS repeat-containing protein, partial [Candidatus Thermoplasmatota archaeon]|nr:VCBS repeat-containing protein [Candidatus Thermoplasmatota archaeon]